MYIIIIIRFFIPPFLLRFAEIVIPSSRTPCNENVEQHVTSSACSTDDSMISIKWVTHESQVKIASPQKSHFKVILNHCCAVELRSSSSVTYLPSYGPRVPGNDWLEIIVHEIKKNLVLTCVNRVVDALGKFGGRARGAAEGPFISTL